MAKTKYNHRRLVNNWQNARTKSIYPGMVIDFKYKGDDIFDKKHMVLILWNDYKNYKFHGINLNYLSNAKIRVLFEKLVEGSKIYNQGKHTGNPFTIEDQDDESGYDDNLPYRNILREPYTRIKLPVFREIREGNPLSLAESKKQMQILYRKVFRKLLKKDDVYRSYHYGKMRAQKIIRYDIEGLMK